MFYRLLNGPGGGEGGGILGGSENFRRWDPVGGSRSLEESLAPSFPLIPVHHKGKIFPYHTLLIPCLWLQPFSQTTALVNYHTRWSKAVSDPPETYL